MKKNISLSLLMICFLVIMKGANVSAAATGSSATGAKIPTYSKVVEITIDKDYISGYQNEYYAIQSALNKARDNATTKVQYKIIIPTGTYMIDSTLKIYSNTYLYCESNVTLKMKPNGKNGNILRCGTNEAYYGYSAIKNIIVEGGTWDNSLLKTDTGYTFSNVRFAHASNIYFKKMNVIYNRNGHHFEFAAVSGLTVESCKFSEFEGTSGKEAIQIDLSNEEVFASFPGYDNLPCKNVVIKNNTFRNVPRGFGSHSAIAGVFHTNITVKGNTFDQIERQAIMAINIKDFTITKNKITNAGAGVEFKYFSDKIADSYIKINGLKYNHDSNANTVISYNEISTVNRSVLAAQFAIRVYGDTYSGSYIPKGDYYVSNMLIKKNKITNIVDGGVCLKGTFDSIVSDNTIKTVKIKSGNTAAKGILLIASKNNTLKANAITAVKGNGITVTDKSSSNKVTSNTVTSCTNNGVTVSNKSKATITSNIIKSNGNNGIIISNQSKAVIKSNTIKSNKNNGITISGKSLNCKITDNTVTVTGNAVRGIAVVSASKTNIVIDKNTVKNNKSLNYFIAADSKATLNGKVRKSYKK